MRKLTDLQLAQIPEMREKGMSYAAIGRWFGVSPGAIQHRCRQNGWQGPGPRTRLTDDQVDQIAELRERGWSCERIARKFGVTAGGVQYRCLRVGARSPRSKAVQPPQRPSERQLFGKRCRPFTADEDAKLLELVRSGMKVTHVARELGRRDVRLRLMTLELKAELT